MIIRSECRYQEAYFSDDSESKVGQRIRDIINMGVPKESLFQLVDNILSENYYRRNISSVGKKALRKSRHYRTAKS